ncbi:hypothetical protein POSPLADRAFT_1157932 [Postia placenta MAD-698-R-SB12]|uniref:Uncharacterized protein n=1 Tax=Postia placenta MAD-698-R-SB12 TaxID=670580 RepID=A0A1X6MKR3_9APHY|nr:hypothetical protein POSPLADRAFT_1157932 [Postia placenta MAD-698-R-SB12]OSX56955.1 hypothetical protein POSPLADRAFT_1157932 [Postia placenta MAD-698-R-SB12]
MRLLPSPDPGDSTDVAQVKVDADHDLKLDALGPMVVNSDGTLSRIVNWQNMTEFERERTMRVLTARNQ